MRVICEREMAKLESFQKVEYMLRMILALTAIHLFSQCLFASRNSLTGIFVQRGCEKEAMRM
jgi:hypothetical protein